MVAALVIFVAAGAPASGVWAQQVQARSFRTLTMSVPQATSAAGVLELRLRWTTGTGAARGAAARQTQSFTLLQRRVAQGSLAAERFPELSDDRLVLVSEDVAGRELDWRIVPNPRLIRAEAPGPDGQLRGGVIERGGADFSIAVPAMPRLARIRIYQPRWTETEFLLDPLGEITIR